MGRLQLTLLMVLAASLSVIACTPSRPPATPEPQFTTTPDATVRSVIQQLQQLERQLDQMVATAEPAVPTATEEPTATELPAEAQAAGEPVRVTAFATRTPRPITAADAQPCSLGQVKANRNSKIYHVPGGGSYAQTKANVVCFDSEAEAAAAGYRKALN